MESTRESKNFFPSGSPQQSKQMHDVSSFADTEAAELSDSDLWNSARRRDAAATAASRQTDAPAQTSSPARANRKRLMTRIIVALSLGTLVAVIAGAVLVTRVRPKVSPEAARTAMIHSTPKDHAAASKKDTPQKKRHAISRSASAKAGSAQHGSHAKVVKQSRPANAKRRVASKQVSANRHASTSRASAASAKTSNAHAVPSKNAKKSTHRHGGSRAPSP